jgi:hypothetical protein
MQFLLEIRISFVGYGTIYPQEKYKEKNMPMFLCWKSILILFHEFLVLKAMSAKNLQ